MRRAGQLWPSQGRVQATIEGVREGVRRGGTPEGARGDLWFWIRAKHHWLLPTLPRGQSPPKGAPTAIRGYTRAPERLSQPSSGSPAPFPSPALPKRRRGKEGKERRGVTGVVSACHPRNWRPRVGLPYRYPSPPRSRSSPLPRFVGKCEAQWSSLSLSNETLTISILVEEQEGLLEFGDLLVAKLRGGGGLGHLSMLRSERVCCEVACGLGLWTTACFQFLRLYKKPSPGLGLVKPKNNPSTTSSLVSAMNPPGLS